MEWVYMQQTAQLGTSPDVLQHTENNVNKFNGYEWGRGI
jgi:hypothetical protein